MKLTQRIVFNTPAKVNFFLNIQKRLPNGYHQLLMDLIPISLFDEIVLSPPETPGIDLKSNLLSVPTDQNLIVKAVKELERYTNQPIDIKIRLRKKIPSGAGLGGGSGNAAGTLVTLNKVLKLRLNEERLRELSLRLGTDVPFFISPKPVVARGIGEKLSPLPPFDRLYLILIYPNISISTSYAYSKCEISGRTRAIQDYSTDGLNVGSDTLNDFWPPLSQTYPVLKKCKQTLDTRHPLFSGISGSGSTLFGVFPDRKSRDAAFSRLSVDTHWRCFRCHTLSHYRYI